MASRFVELGEEIAAKRQHISEIFQQARTGDGGLDMDKVTIINGTSAEKIVHIRKSNEELAPLVDEYTQLKELLAIADATNVGEKVLSHKRDPKEGEDEKGPQQFSIAKAAVRDENYLRHKGDAKPRFTIDLPDVDLKTLMTTTTGFPPESVRSGLMVPYALRRPMVADLIPQDSINQPSVVYMEETTFTNNAAPVAEGAPKPESALAYTQRSIPVEVIATWIPITRQQLDDVAQLEALLNNRLRLMLSLAEENQLLNGSGTTPDLIGFYNKSGIQTQAKGADPTPDALYKAMTKVRFTGFADPSGIVMHPNDWQDIRLLRTVNGEYIWGSPAEIGVERVWGLPVVVTTAATENTALLGDFVLYSHISRKMGVTLDVSDQHNDYFIQNKLAVRIEERLSLEIYRPSAFCLVTGV